MSFIYMNDNQVEDLVVEKTFTAETKKVRY